MSTAHWDEVEAQDDELGPIGRRRRDLGHAAGSVAVGAARIEVSPGHQATPLHAHDAVEELFYVLAGGGHSVTEDGACAIGPGDAILYPPGRPAHTIVAGEEGLDVLAFGPRRQSAAVRFPRIEAIRLGGMVLHARAEHQWQLEAEQGLVEIVPGERPPTVRNVAELPSREMERDRAKATAWWIGRALGATTTALNRADIAPGHEAAPLHCHSAEEELFVVLDGDGVLILGGAGRDEEEEPVRAGSIVSRPAGSGVAHAFRAGDRGMSILMYSDKHSDDMCFYPRTGKVAIRGLGIVVKPELTTFWD